MLLGPLGRGLAEQRLNRVEGLLIDDGQARHRKLLRRLRLDPARALSGRRILGHLDPVPNQPPDKERIAQDPVAAGARPVDSRGVPQIAARRRHPFSIQTGSDRPRLHARQAHRKNAPDRGGLVRDNFRLARPR
ncbi:MAG: hypothetical protein KDJ20_00695 [Hyphomicrobiales bacterium]|nr:hypothetical protein [Hyphomicrobiales bacterium]MCC2106756.1 hypothetical protein [Hyphomicrobiales bacterium]